MEGEEGGMDAALTQPCGVPFLNQGLQWVTPLQGLPPPAPHPGTPTCALEQGEPLGWAGGALAPV